MEKKEKVLGVLGEVKDPWMGIDYVAARMAKVSDDGSSVSIELGYPAKNEMDGVRERVQQALAAQGLECEVSVSQKIIAHAVQRTLKVLPNVKNIIAVSSGKGGVGKSTVAANLALALSAEGAKVGMLDADIYGPSQPMMLGALGRPMTNDGQKMNPVETLGLELNSIGFLVDADEPMIWRGPLAAQALTQLLTLTNWHDLDYLVVDMPPGTGDIQLTLSQTVPVTGAIVVTTPQDIALLDAKKGLRMFQKVNVPILGLVENMSVFICPQCGHVEHIFGEGGASRMSRTYHVDVLGQLPLEAAIREQTDSGSPTVVSSPESPAAKIYREIAMKAAAAIAKTAKDMSLKMPAVRVEND
ncbi:MAG TPA: iron-sulfur cluster carrier protein ApbC [Candidatus Aphodousia gallistercoris]|nr:iron-sulfur cluster carrier protein ApbC [Candidatus Aphodousia gallistercoris]